MKIPYIETPERRKEESVLETDELENDIGWKDTSPKLNYNDYETGNHTEENNDVVLDNNSDDEEKVTKMKKSESDANNAAGEIFTVVTKSILM